MTGLETPILILLIICITAVCVFEFINGFHDTANAVATCIYTHTLPARVAVVWSGIWNFIGLYFSYKVAVALGIIKLLPMQDITGLPITETISVVLALLLSAIVWNLGTWYFGIPCSSSHTLIGAILGVGLAFSWVHRGDGVNWDKAIDIGKSLLISPLFGFSCAIMLMFIIRQIVKNNRKEIFKEPQGNTPPPLGIRISLIITCTLVSFFHGSNDGQKGVGLLLIILLTFMPVKYALNESFDIQKSRVAIENIENGFHAANIHRHDQAIGEAYEHLNKLENPDHSGQERFIVRKKIQNISKAIDEDIDIFNSGSYKKYKNSIETSNATLMGFTDFCPTWVKLLIALCLGIGTMVGYKRIVVTIGEKIGKRHMTYAEGLSAELIAAITIGLSTKFGLPVSTTHVLSSGIAGAMTASKGVKNLQSGTIGNIVLAWVLTLPATIGLSIAFYYFFRLIL